MQTIKVNVYNYTELNDNAKQRVKDWVFRDGYFWADEAWASLRSLKKIFPGLNIESADFSPYADVEYRESQIDENLLNLSGARLRTWLINNIYEYLWERQPQGKYTKNENTGKWSYKRRSRIIYKETSCPFTGYCMDDDILQPIRDFIATPSDKIDFSDLIWKCIHAWKISAEADCKGQESDEYLADLCETNGYQFYENGEIH